MVNWDIVNGLHSTFPEFLPTKDKDIKLDQEEALNWFDNLLVPSDKYLILVLKDYSKFFGHSNYRGQLENKIIRHIKNLSQSLTKQNKTIILLSSTYEIPADIDKNVHTLDWPLPEKEDIETINSWLGFVDKMVTHATDILEPLPF